MFCRVGHTEKVTLDQRVGGNGQRRGEICARHPKQRRRAVSQGAWLGAEGLVCLRHEQGAGAQTGTHWQRGRRWGAQMRQWDRAWEVG